ncbi:MAG: glycoside hydrolase family 9 protein [Streptosporangiaceae bacterium]|nr:glycoside hydrolase family 9 protein [Streptosporangiaceae bacterium]
MGVTTLGTIALAGMMGITAVIATKTTIISAEVRINQVGYVTNASKVAFAMLPQRVANVAFTITAGNRVVFRGVSRDDLGAWNKNYPAVYELDFSSLRSSGTYRVHVGSAVSSAFAIASPAVLYTRLVNNGVRYFTSERDGPDVNPSVLNRQPANLTDEHAYVYADPDYDSNDNLIGTFHKIGGPVDVSGGWFDAGGGYEKFAYTASYADALLLMAQRALLNKQGPRESATLGAEAQFGLEWLAKLWNPAQKVMYIQVGIGNGSAPTKQYPNGQIQGDYNFWFTPQSEDRLNVSKGGDPGPTAYYVKYRPVFEAAPPGQPVSPELAGRFAADFALAAQLRAKGDPVGARELLTLARGVYADARTTNVGQITTTFPHDYYPGSEWQSAMAWGAAELALADAATGASSAQLHTDLEAAARWTRAYLAEGPHRDTFNLYDNGAVAEAELLRAMHATDQRVIAPGTVLNDMAAQLRAGQAAAKGDPFQLGTQLGASDASPHAFGLYITNALYTENGGSTQYRSFAQQQLNFALGANAWGSSFVAGAGSTFPHCMQSEIANLNSGIQLGATTDGPSGTSNFTGLGTAPGMRACSAGNYGPFDTATASYEDNVVAWPSVEPADDYTANSLFAFALGAVGLG